MNGIGRTGVPGLTVSGNSVDTERYVTTGSNQYMRPNDGIKAGDEMVSIMTRPPTKRPQQGCQAAARAPLLQELAMLLEQLVFRLQGGATPVSGGPVAGRSQ